MLTFFFLLEKQMDINIFFNIFHVISIKTYDESSEMIKQKYILISLEILHSYIIFLEVFFYHKL